MLILGIELCSNLVMNVVRKEWPLANSRIEFFSHQIIKQKAVTAV